MELTKETFQSIEKYKNNLSLTKFLILMSLLVNSIAWKNNFKAVLTNYKYSKSIFKTLKNCLRNL